MKSLVFLACVGVALCNTPVTITNTWNGGFQGYFKLNPSSDLHGWKVHIVCDKPLDNVEVLNHNNDYRFVKKTILKSISTKRYVSFLHKLNDYLF